MPPLLSSMTVSYQELKDKYSNLRVETLSKTPQNPIQWKLQSIPSDGLQLHETVNTLLNSLHQNQSPTAWKWHLTAICSFFSEESKIHMNTWPDIEHGNSTSMHILWNIIREVWTIPVFKMERFYQFAFCTRHIIRQATNNCKFNIIRHCRIVLYIDWCRQYLKPKYQIT